MGKQFGFKLRATNYLASIIVLVLLLGSAISLLLGIALTDSTPDQNLNTDKDGIIFDSSDGYTNSSINMDQTYAVLSLVGSSNQFCLTAALHELWLMSSQANPESSFTGVFLC